MRTFSVSLPVSAMIAKQGKHFTTAKILKKVCKTLFVTVTILSPNFLLNDLLQNHCRYTSNDGKLSHDDGDISTPFLPLSVGFFLFKYVSTLLFALLT